MRKKLKKTFKKIDKTANALTEKDLSRLDIPEGFEDLPERKDTHDFEKDTIFFTKMDTKKANQQPVSEIIDKLNADNTEADPAKSYLDVNELGKWERIVFAVNRLSLLLERARMGDYVSMMGNTKGMLIKNFFAGIARGLGFGLGFLLLGALGLYILNAVVESGIPIIGDFLAQILNYVDEIRKVRY